jgi:hypothetical protein
LRENRNTYCHTLLKEFYVILKVLRGVSYGSGKTRKTKQGETAKKIGKGNQKKKVLGKLNGTRSITFNDLFNCLI